VDPHWHAAAGCLLWQYHWGAGNPRWQLALGCGLWHHQGWVPATLSACCQPELGLSFACFRYCGVTRVVGFGLSAWRRLEQAGTTCWVWTWADSPAPGRPSAEPRPAAAAMARAQEAASIQALRGEEAWVSVAAVVMVSLLRTRTVWQRCWLPETRVQCAQQHRRRPIQLRLHLGWLLNHCDARSDRAGVLVSRQH